MISRALLVVGSLLASPAWAQDHSFDFNGDAVRKIVRNTAASQYAEVRPLKPAEPRQALLIDLRKNLRLDEKPALKRPTARSTPIPTLSAPLSALVDILVDVNNFTTPKMEYTEWRHCQRAGDTSNTPSLFMCPTRQR